MPETHRDGDSESAHFLQGLADRVAEDMAQYLHDHLRCKMGLNPGAGQRYSPGYPALKDIGVNRVIAELLHAASQLEIKLTDVGEFDPPGTTDSGTVVVGNPGATPVFDEVILDDDTME